MRFSSCRLQIGAMLFGLSTFALVGCGGGSDHSSPTTTTPSPTATAAATPTPGTGRLTLTVQWPERTRGIPKAANSVRVLIQQQGNYVREALLVRPPSGAATSAVLDGLPLGDVSLSVFAYPEEQGTGIIQASAVLPATITAQGGTVIALTTTSRIDHLLVALGYLREVGQMEAIRVEARDAEDNVVLIDRSTLQWTSSDPSVATITGGFLDALAPGTTTITVTETESGKALSQTLEVRATPTPPSYDPPPTPPGG